MRYFPTVINHVVLRCWILTYPQSWSLLFLFLANLYASPFRLIKPLISVVSLLLATYPILHLRQTVNNCCCSSPMRSINDCPLISTVMPLNIVPQSINANKHLMVLKFPLFRLRILVSESNTSVPILKKITIISWSMVKRGPHPTRFVITPFSLHNHQSEMACSLIAPPMYWSSKPSHTLSRNSTSTVER